MNAQYKQSNTLLLQNIWQMLPRDLIPRVNSSVVFFMLRGLINYNLRVFFFHIFDSKDFQPKIMIHAVRPLKISCIEIVNHFTSIL
jgi:hypothetical protein